jgi:hypothetical protein
MEAHELDGSWWKGDVLESEVKVPGDVAGAHGLPGNGIIGATEATELQNAGLVEKVSWHIRHLCDKEVCGCLLRVGDP